MTAGDDGEKTNGTGLPHTHIVRRLVVTCAVLCVILAGAGAAAVSLGPYPIRLRDLWAAVMGQAPANVATILMTVRLPRIALGALVGCSLSVAGGAFQGMLMNPLADPYLIGVSSGAALGASLAIVLNVSGAGGFGVPLAAFLFALATMVLVYRLAQIRGKIPVESFILAGVVVGSFMWALVTVIMALAGKSLSEVVFWLMGNLFVEGWGPVGIVLGATVVGMVGLYAFARELNLLALGEESAQQLGVDVERLKRLVIVFGSLLTAAAVSFSGIIGFVGLIMPHIARRIVGPDHRVLLPAAGLIGASFLVLADTVARVAGPWELPVGVITSLLGAPFFLYLLRTRTRG
ncbi:MAG: iron chelate uptake ABC transporter family permease subunit [Armatimonadota bacterium]|nr:MAG: iron chelate uptake ABC transporter family permease subunit [Armatimonadota bacterium]